MDSKKSPAADHILDTIDDNDDHLLSDDSRDDDMAVAVAQVPQPFAPPPGSQALQQPAMQSSSPAANKRYRPAPAKTFQCRGYGECRMVFSRSEHLARHIRKHTGERPFSCHCGKHFSRLDNLRQHAQTVHADKQEQNERMMQELTSLHATMTASTKGSNRSKRGQAAVATASNATGSPVAHSPSGVAPASAGSNTGGSSPGARDVTMSSMSIKQEEGTMSMPMSMRPGTSTGYEGTSGLYPPSGSWSSDVDHRVNNHSFRDPGQSFRVPPASATATAALNSQHSHTKHPGQSFLAPSVSAATFNFSLPDIGDATPSSNTSRPGTASRPATATDRPGAVALPPISTVVPASLPPSLALPHLAPTPLFVPGQRERDRDRDGTPLTSSHILPLPTPSYAYGPGGGRRPSTATRPGTAPASYYYGQPASQQRPRTGNGGNGGGGVPVAQLPRPELSLSLTTTAGPGRRGAVFGAGGYGGYERVYRGYGHGHGYGEYGYDDADADGDGAEPGSGADGDEPTSPAGGTYDSPFSYHAPATTTTTISSLSSASSSATTYQTAPFANPRKRPYSGSDDDERGGGGGDVRAPSRPATGYEHEYEYGTESRPQSRRLSLMELCNDTDDEPAARAIVPLSGAAFGRVCPGEFGRSGNGSGRDGNGGYGGGERPVTSSGLVAGASQLALVDRDDGSRSPEPEFARTRTPSVSADTGYGGTGARRSADDGAVYAGFGASAEGADVAVYRRGTAAATRAGEGTAREGEGATTTGVLYEYGYGGYRSFASSTPASPGPGPGSPQSPPPATTTTVLSAAAASAATAGAGIRRAAGVASPAFRGESGAGVGGQHGWRDVSATAAGSPRDGGGGGSVSPRSVGSAGRSPGGGGGGGGDGQIRIAVGMRV